MSTDAVPDQPLPATAFRTATPEDVREIAGWIHSRRDCELWAGPRLPYPLDPELLPGDIDLYHADSVALVEARRLIAFGQVIYMDEDRAHLARIIVAPARRGRGYGRLLVRELMRRAHERGYATVSLYVDRYNRRALALYLRFGFVRAERPQGELASARTVYMLSHTPQSASRDSGAAG